MNLGRCDSQAQPFPSCRPACSLLAGACERPSPPNTPWQPAGSRALQDSILHSSRCFFCSYFPVYTEGNDQKWHFQVVRQMVSQEAEEPAGESFTPGSPLALKVARGGRHHSPATAVEASPGRGPGHPAWSVGDSWPQSPCHQLPGAVHPSLSWPVIFPSQSPLLGPGLNHRTKCLTP